MNRVDSPLPPSEKLKIVLISYHYFGSKKKAGFHFLAKAFKDMGHDVTFATGFFSFLSLIRNDRRIKEKGFLANIFKPRTIEGVTSIVNGTIFHPAAALPNFLNVVFKNFVTPRSHLVLECSNADIVIFESDPSLLYKNKLSYKKTCKVIYRVSDSLKMLGLPKQILEIEKDIAHTFTSISCPTKVIYDTFQTQNKHLLHHGIQKDFFDNDHSLTPYKRDSINHVFIGNSYLDFDFLHIASTIFPNHDFHIFGSFPSAKFSKNVHFHGYKNFTDLVPYIKHANTGLHTVTNENNVAESLGDSLKVHQYTYCNLPIIAPSVIKTSRSNFFRYEYQNKKTISECIEAALKTQLNFDSPVNDWKDVAKKMIED